MSKNDSLLLSFTHSAQIHLNKLVQKVEQVLYIKLRNLMENLLSICYNCYQTNIYKYIHIRYTEAVPQKRFAGERCFVNVLQILGGAFVRGGNLNKAARQLC